LKSLKSLAGQTVVYGLPSIIGRFLSYLLVPLYTYTFVPGEYGKITFIYAYISFINILLTYGMETSLFNFSRLEEDKKKVYSTILISVISTSVLFVAIIGFFRQTFAGWMHLPEHPEYILWLAIILSSDAISAIAFAKLRQLNKARRFATIKTLNILIYIFSNLFFILLCPKIYKNPGNVLYPLIQSVYSPNIGIGYILISNLIASAATLLMLFPDLIKAFIAQPQTPGAWGGFDSALWKRMAPYAMPLVFAGLAGMVNETLDRVLLQYLLPPDVRWQQGGIYSACYKISIIITMFVQAFKYASEPYFFANAHEKDFAKTFADIVKYFIIGCLLIFLGTMLNISWLKYFVGEKYWEGLKVVPILLLANLCLGVFYTLSTWYKLTNKTLYGAYLTIIGAIITIVLNIYWIPRIGYIGCAWATLICYATVMVLSYFMSRKSAGWKIKYDFFRISIYFALSLILYFLSTQINVDSKVVALVINNGLILIFLIVVYFMEKSYFFTFEGK
jgi:O-antigen/teichoic acid export membrane protein